MWPLGNTNHSEMVAEGHKNDSYTHTRPQTNPEKPAVLTPFSGTERSYMEPHVHHRNWQEKRQWQCKHAKQNNTLVNDRKWDIESKNTIPKCRKKPECKAKGHYETKLRTHYGRMVRKGNRLTH